MFITVKLAIYLIAAHLFYTNGFDPAKKLMDFTVLMGCILMMDVVSYSAAKFALEGEKNESKKPN